MTTGTEVTIEQARAVEARLREIASPNAHPCFKAFAADTIAALITALEAAQAERNQAADNCIAALGRLEEAQADAARYLTGDLVLVSRRVIERTLYCLNTPHQADLHLVLCGLYAAIAAQSAKEGA